MINLNDPDQAARLILNSLSQEEITLSDVHVKTLDSHYEELLYEKALNKCSKILTSIQPNEEKINRVINKTLLTQPPAKLRQFVEYDSNGHITVCIDSDHVDDNAWFEVISILSTVQDKQIGVVEFGPTITKGRVPSTQSIVSKRREFV